MIVALEDLRRAGVEAGRRQYIEITGREPNSASRRVIEAAVNGALAGWDDRPLYRRPSDEELAWPLLNGTWPIGTPSRVLGGSEEESSGREESQADDQEA